MQKPQIFTAEGSKLGHSDLGFIEGLWRSILLSTAVSLLCRWRQLGFCT